MVHFDFFVTKCVGKVSGILHQKKKLMQNALIWYIHQNVPIVTLVQNALSLYNAKCNNVIKSEN